VSLEFFINIIVPAAL